MTNEEQWKKNLDDAVLVTTGLVLRHADLIKDQEEWLASHVLGMKRFDERLEAFEESQKLAAKRHDEEMAEIRAAPHDLTRRLGGGSNGHGDA